MTAPAVDHAAETDRAAGNAAAYEGRVRELGPSLERTLAQEWVDYWRAREDEHRAAWLAELAKVLP